MARFTGIARLVAALVVMAAGPATAQVAPAAADAYAWSGNGGWFDLRPDATDGVKADGEHLEGRAWAPNFGWVDFGDGTPASGSTYSNASASDFGVNRDAEGWLSGHAWAPNVGWIRFDWATPGTPGLPRWDPVGNRITGSAWASNVGWIAFGSHDVFEITIPDLALREALLAALERDAGAITNADLAGLTTLQLSGLGISDLTGLRHAVSLQSIDLSDNRVSSVLELVPITGLQVVDVSRNRISDLAPLRHVSIRELRAADNAVRSLAGFQEMLLLEVLDLAGNAVRDLEPLAALPALRELDVSRNKLESLAPLADVQVLRVLRARRNLIDDITLLAQGDNAKRLLALDVRENRIDLAPAFGQQDLLLTRFVAAPPEAIEYLPQLLPPVEAGTAIVSVVEPGIAAPTTGAAVASNVRFLVTGGTLPRGDGSLSPVAYVHERDGAGWRQVATLRPSGDVAIFDDSFRVGILDDSFLGDGAGARIVMAGAFVVEGGKPRPGVLVFALGASGWSFETTLLHGGEVGILDDSFRAGIFDDSFRSGSVSASERISLLGGNPIGIFDDSFRMSASAGRIALGGLALQASDPFVGARVVSFELGATGWTELPVLDPVGAAGIFDDSFRGATGFDLAAGGGRLRVAVAIRSADGGSTTHLLGFAREPVSMVSKPGAAVSTVDLSWYVFEELATGGDLDFEDMVIQVFFDASAGGEGGPVETVVLAGVSPDEEGDGETSPRVFILQDSGLGLAEIAVIDPAIAAELAGRWGNLALTADPSTGRIVLGGRVLDAGGDPSAGLVLLLPGEEGWTSGPVAVLPESGASLALGLAGDSIVVGGAPRVGLDLGTTLLVPLALVTGTEEPILFADAALEAAARAAIERPSGPLYPDDFAGLSELSVRELGIANLSGIERLTSLVYLFLGNNEVRSIEPLRGLDQLQFLELYGNPVEDFSVLTDPRLAGLLHLDLRLTGFTDLSLLAGLAAPDSLLIGDADLVDFGAIATMTNLRSLRQLNLEDSPIRTLEPLLPLASLQKLVLSGSMVDPEAWSLFTNLGNWPALRSLWARGTSFTNLQVLEGRPIEVLDVSDCDLESLAPLAGAGLLSLLNLQLDFVQGLDLTPIASLPQLVSLSLYGCAIQDFSFLAGMNSLTHLTVGANSAASLGPIPDLASLEYLDVRFNFLDLTPGSPVSTSIAAMEASGVEVLATPQRVEAHIPDEALLAAIRYFLRMPVGRIGVEDVASLTELVAFGVGDLTGLEHAAQLRLLQVEYGSVTSLAPLAGLDRLRFLFLRENAIADLAPLAPLEGLDTLDLTGNAITDLAPLGSKPVLRILLAGENAIASVFPLSEYRGLVQLNLEGNALTTLAGLGTKPELRILDIDRNAVTTLAGLSGSTGLRELTAVGNRIADLSPLAAMRDLDSVVVDDNLVATLYPLRGLEKLRYVVATLNLLDLTPTSDDSADITAIRALPLSPLVIVEPQRTSGSDGDDDGLPDSFEQAIVDADPFDAITGPADVRPDDDFDGDGQSNRFEFIAGTGATDPMSRLGIQSFEENPVAGTATLIVTVGEGREFKLEYSTSPGGPWFDSGLGWVRSEGVIVERTFAIPALPPGAQRFYRVSARIAVEL